MNRRNLMLLTAPLVVGPVGGAIMAKLPQHQYQKFGQIAYVGSLCGMATVFLTKPSDPKWVLGMSLLTTTSLASIVSSTLVASSQKQNETWCQQVLENHGNRPRLLLR